LSYESCEKLGNKRQDETDTLTGTRLKPHRLMSAQTFPSGSLTECGLFLTRLFILIFWSIIILLKRFVKE